MRFRRTLVAALAAVAIASTGMAVHTALADPAPLHVDDVGRWYVPTPPGPHTVIVCDPPDHLKPGDPLPADCPAPPGWYRDRP